jgi:hypothetical protein
MLKVDCNFFGGKFKDAVTRRVLDYIKLETKF